jgi:hypothetical protein
VLAASIIALMMEAARTSETSVNFHQTTQLCQTTFGVRIPNRQTFEIDRKLDILVTALVYIMIGGVIKAFIVALCFIKL